MRIELWHKNKLVGSQDFTDGTYKVGRAEDSDIFIASLQVSKNHAVLAISGEQVVIADQGSANGVFVNGTKVKKQAIGPGDQIVLADFTLKLGETQYERVLLAS